jgi:hypothetical protein
MSPYRPAVEAPAGGLNLIRLSAGVSWSRLDTRIEATRLHIITGTW